jgi:ubiquinone/menaquinone biosynthesis C-methylase UbiE
VDIAKKKNVYSDVKVLNMHERPFAFEDNQFAAVNCLGVLTYVENVPKVLREFIRITKPGGLVIFSHRDDMATEPEFVEKFEAIEKDNLWEKIFISDPEPYLPENEDFSDKINVIYYAFRVL